MFVAKVLGDDRGALVTRQICFVSDLFCFGVCVLLGSRILNITSFLSAKCEFCGAHSRFPKVPLGPKRLGIPSLIVKEQAIPRQVAGMG